MSLLFKWLSEDVFSSEGGGVSEAGQSRRRPFFPKAGLKIRVHQNYLGDLLKQTAGQTSRVSDSVDLR